MDNTRREFGAKEREQGRMRCRDRTEKSKRERRKQGWSQDRGNSGDNKTNEGIMRMRQDKRQKRVRKGSEETR